MQQSTKFILAFVAGAILLGLGAAAGGYFAGRGVLAARLSDRVVTVKGVAETETMADLATYPLRVTVTDGDLARATQRLDANIAQVMEFLRQYGFTDDELAVQRIEVQDTLAQGYRPDGGRENSRYILTQSALIRSSRIELVTQVSQETDELVRRGIVLSEGAGPTYAITAQRLKELKPDLIRRATLAARGAADEFAATSGAQVGDIRRANQGVIVVLARDSSPMRAEFQSAAKRVRAVVTIDYFLQR